MSDFEIDLEAAIAVYKEHGLITRRDFISMDSRPWARKLHHLMIEKGYEHIGVTEVVIDNYRDYHTIIFDYTIFKSAKKASEYVIRRKW